MRPASTSASTNEKNSTTTENTVGEDTLVHGEYWGVVMSAIVTEIFLENVDGNG